MYLAHELGSVINRLPADFQRHIIWAFSTRTKQQDSVLCRLALYLDPRFRQAASSSASGRTEFIQKAAQYTHAQVGGWCSGGGAVGGLVGQFAVVSGSSLMLVRGSSVRVCVCEFAYVCVHTRARMCLSVCLCLAAWQHHSLA